MTTTTAATTMKHRKVQEEDELPLNVEKIRANIERMRPAAGTELTVLISSGSLAPIHLAHMGMFEHAQRAISAPPHNAVVVGGYACPSSDWYVQQKLGAHHIPLRMRNEMVRLATAESELVECLEWGWANGPAIAKTVRQRLAALIPEYRWTCREMHGADVALRCCERTNYPLIVLGRPGSTQELRDQMAASSHPNRHMIIVEGELPDISSTAVRAATVAKDEATLRKFLHPIVARYMANIVCEELHWA
jgi:nicotinic acid mononucleotide adenylyltransferase